MVYPIDFYYNGVGIIEAPATEEYEKIKYFRNEGTYA